MAIAVFFLIHLTGAVHCPRIAQLPQALEEEGCCQGAALALGTDLQKIILPAGMKSLSHICYTTPDGLQVGHRLGQGLQDWGVQGASKGGGW